MTIDQVRAELKELIVRELNLDGKAPSDIDDAAPLFGAGLGLDSLDALQLAMSVEECARQILEATHARKRQLVMTLQARIGLWLQLLAPKVVDRMVLKSVKDEHK